MPASRELRIDQEPVAPAGDGPGYFGTRFTRNKQRGTVWHHICQFLQTWIPVEVDWLLSSGCGLCGTAPTPVLG